ncbi:MAG: putative sugar phosphate isomerase YwlF [Alphaproteobacteria bacterium MarineAlpha11_Bin1]|nr:MAG: putative sugar phosphate isomerase YwlF [Alphaproteobacteria bacterium MarineAlpha11_Bin1]|tara:strand:- start:12326 stop:12760 length:435 start_codon:yes stop_codon:yes gene_type:complete
MSEETIGIAADHGGFALKQVIKDRIEAAGYRVLDLGTDSEDAVDYPDFAEKLVQAITSGQIKRGILFCGTGIGVSIAANRHKGIRAALCYDEETIILSRQHNDANILCLGGRKTGEVLAARLVALFLETDFEGGRHTGRVKKLG